GHGAPPVACVIPADRHFEIAGDQASSNPALSISRGSRGTPPWTPPDGHRFLTCSCPLGLSLPGKSGDPGTPFLRHHTTVPAQQGLGRHQPVIAQPARPAGDRRSDMATEATRAVIVPDPPPGDNPVRAPI